MYSQYLSTITWFNLEAKNQNNLGTSHGETGALGVHGTREQDETYFVVII